MAEKRMRAAYHAESALLAEAQLEALAKELERTHPGAAASLHEGLSETLTVLRLGVPTLAHPADHQQHRVDDLHRPYPLAQRQALAGRQTTLRWCAAGIVEAGEQFRRVNGQIHLPALRKTLDAHVAAQTVGAVRQDDNMIAA